MAAGKGEGVVSATTWSKFFWADWLSDPALTTCSLAAQGMWMRLLCVAAQATPTGFVVVNGRPLGGTDIARLCGVSETEAGALLDELDRNGVLSRDRKGAIYSRRLVRDAARSAKAKEFGKRGGNPSLSKQTGKEQTLNPLDNINLNRGVPHHMPEARGLDNPSIGLSNPASPEKSSATTARDGLLNGKPPPRAGEGEPYPEPPRRVFVAFDTPEWTAWSRHYRAIGKTPHGPDSHFEGRNGWWFPSMMPPKGEAAA